MVRCPFRGILTIFISGNSTRKALAPNSKQGEELSKCYSSTGLFHSHRFRQVSRLVYVFPFEQGDMVGK